MKKALCIFLVLIPLAYYCIDSNAKPVVVQSAAVQNTYSFAKTYDAAQSIASRIPAPAGFKRMEAAPGSFADWLRHLPLKPGKPDVHLYNGKLKADQNVHYAVVDIDAGTSDLQQCADAVMRMRAEYLYAIHDYENLHFNFTSGHSIGFKKWSSGFKPVIKGNTVTWAAAAGNNSSYKSFRSYMDVIFTYAGTLSLSKELKPVADLKTIRIGDVFIVGGSPGHAVLVVDVCENPKTGERLFMIQQSYMPAQEIHILKNYTNSSMSPWYSVNFSGDLETPQWTFGKDQLMRF